MTQIADKQINSTFDRGRADFRTFIRSSVALVQAIRKNCTEPAYIDGMCAEAEMTAPAQVSQVRKVAEMYAAGKGGSSPMQFSEALAHAYEVMKPKKSGAPKKSKAARAATYWERGVKQFGLAAMRAAAK